MKVTSILLALFVFSLPAFSQEENLNKMLDEFLFGKSFQDSLLESIEITDMDLKEILNTLDNYKFIYVRSEFENKTFFSGQDIGVDQYNIAGQVCYQGSKGLNIGIAGIMYSEFEPQYNTTELTVGYNNHIFGAKGLSIRALYSRYFFAKVDSMLSNDFNSSANIGMTYQWKGFGSSADFALLLGKETSTQVNWDIFAYIPVMKFGLSNKLNIEPEVSFYFGNQTVIVNQLINLPWYKGEKFTEKKYFGLMNTMIRIPLSLYLGNMDISAGYNFNLTRMPGGDTNPDNTSFFNISVGYVFGF
jgi:hypothetical protein